MPTQPTTTIDYGVEPDDAQILVVDRSDDLGDALIGDAYLHQARAVLTTSNPSTGETAAIHINARACDDLAAWLTRAAALIRAADDGKDG